MREGGKKEGGSAWIYILTGGMERFKSRSKAWQKKAKKKSKDIQAAIQATRRDFISQVTIFCVGKPLSSSPSLPPPLKLYSGLRG